MLKSQQRYSENFFYQKIIYTFVVQTKIETKYE
jgi:hypothetical protein